MSFLHQWASHPATKYLQNGGKLEHGANLWFLAVRGGSLNSLKGVI